MCGIVGAVGPDAQSFAEVIRTEVSRMRCRGPDAEGFFQGADVVLAHRRLSILDLSSRSNQPFASPSGRFILTYNGEIYNFREINSSVESDTQALMADPPAALNPRRLRGMFAYALWDTLQHQLTLVRDRFGMKPLYYTASGRNLVFASTTMALARISGHSTLSSPALASYLRLGSVQGPHTIFEDIHELGPGSILRWHDGASASEEYWDWSDALSEPEPDLHSTLREAVSAHCVSDVPVAVFLSGGLDSAIISALAVEAGIEVTALTLGFPGLKIDETRRATATARALGLKHEVIETDDPLGQIDAYFYQADQPTIDGLNTYLISAAAASRGFHVALSGLGADELFGGYSTFRRLPLISALNAACPTQLAAWMLEQTPGNSTKARDLAECRRDRIDLYEELRSVFSTAEVVSLIHEPWHLQRIQTKGHTLADVITGLELHAYLRNTLLRDADVFSMANSLELRTPFVDHYVLGSAFALKSSMRIVRGKRSIADAIGLRRLRTLARSKKQGFTLPYDVWLRGPLQHRVHELEVGPLCTLLDSDALTFRVDQWEAGNGTDMRVWALVALDAWLRTRD